MKAFRFEFSDNTLTDLIRRIKDMRWPAQVNDENWSYGTDLDYLQSFCKYWCEEYNWREQERLFNQFDHFMHTIDGQSLHFIHQRSKHEDATPIIITHGWPGSVSEFLKIIPMLCDPTAHGGNADQAFHVVCPSIPGFGLSPSASTPGMQPTRVAQLQAQLMADLGYERYIAQGGDWGSIISATMARLDAEHCAGLHLNMVIANPPEGASGVEDMGDQINADYMKTGMGYYQIQSTKPQTLSYLLADSPVGLAAWIIEKFRDWSDCAGKLENSYSRDELLNNIMLYWLSGDPGAAGRIYYETVNASDEIPLSRIEVPTGAAVFPKEIFRPPRAWAEQSYNIVHWEEMPKGGHFAAMEVPDLLAQDLRQFVAKIRPI